MKESESLEELADKMEELADKVEEVEIDVEGGDSSDEEAESKEALEEIEEEVEGEETSEDHIGEDAPEEDVLDASDGGISEASDDELEEEEPALSAGTGSLSLCVYVTKYTIFCSVPAWAIEQETKKLDHVRGKKGKVKKMKEKYKDQVKLIPISHSMLFEIFLP